MLIAIYIFILGLLWGSFINAAAWRLRLESKDSLLTGRSKCPNCEHELSAKDLIPVLSWMSQKGKCRYCGKSISARYPVVELFTAVLFLLSYISVDQTVAYWPWLLTWWLVNVVWLLVLAIIDVRWMQLPYKITFPLLGFNVTVVLILGYLGVVSVSAYLAAGAIAAGVFGVLWAISKGKWIGDGDIPLLASLGLILGPFATLFAVFAGSFVGSVYAITMIGLGKRTREQPLPYGPLLILGTFIAYFLSSYIEQYLFIM